MKKLILSLAVAGAVAGCSKPENSSTTQAEAASTQQVTAEQVSRQQAALGSGIDLDAMNTDVRPQDDFFAYVNGRWLEETEIPADKSRWGTFDQLAELSTQRVKSLIEEASKHADSPDAKKIGALFNSFMNEELIEELGMEAIADEMAKIDAIEDREQLTRYFAYADTMGYDAPFGVFINQDVKDVESYTAYFWQSGLGMPDRDYYFDDSDKGKKLQQAYQEYLVEVQQLAGLENAGAKAKAIYELEKNLAEHQWTRVDNRDPDKTYNKKTLAELAELMPAIDWDIYLPEAKLQGLESVVVGQPDYFEQANRIVADTDLDTWKRYLKVKLLTSMAPYMHEELAQARFDFYGTAIRGVTEMEPRWKRGVQVVNGGLGELVGKRYVEKHFPPEAKARMLELVDNLKAAYRDSIESLTWMSEETKQQALDKLANFSTKIGYPDEWRDYTALTVSTEDLVGNVLASRRFETAFQRSKLGQPIDRGEWHMHPQRVNAYYNPPMNEIVFPAAILQPPFFNMEAEDAVNYGGIGAVIGHEIGHGFDDKGSKYDGKGYLNNWWTDSDRANFEKLTGQLVNQFNEFEPLDGEHINGELTLGENIGDLSGLGIAHKAYRMSLDGEEAPVIDGFTGDQRLFMGWAQVWRGKTRDEALRTRLKTDPHSPKKYRVQGILPNLPAFYTAFDVNEGDEMYLPEEERVTIW
ncbi:M13 family metallopeptidase [Microbulbifer yueqingensis]|uniref:Endothelin-converting enzyme Metallo peptidase. MEROPS family M13 n=1 Tax=Microbulbifer yueqingensis TaxID=658219 RepID=A0A1G8XSA1_9GAMM|nr:M13 family metallopeptidase [Microbulbifer yueqingensis]SDJ93431.1 endothelin-converting enzyme Metallo peptidase. MEROPS family M13 [Microbulbifer yueqingensis]